MSVTFTGLLKLHFTRPGKKCFSSAVGSIMLLLLSGICSQCKCTGARLQIKCSSGCVWVWRQPRKLWSLSASSVGIVQRVGLKSAWYRYTMRQSCWGSDDGLFSCTVVLTGCWGKLISEWSGFLWDSYLVACSSCSTWDSHFFPSPLPVSWVVASLLIQLLMVILGIFCHQRWCISVKRVVKVLDVCDHAKSHLHLEFLQL